MKLLAVDGTNLVMRYAYAQLSAEQRVDPSPESEAQILRGAESAIRELSRVLDLHHAVIAVDSAADTWRREIFPPYKAHRKGGCTGGWSKRLHDDFGERGWCVLAVPGQEADDIIATVAGRASARGIEVAILSSDSDLLQLVGPTVEVYQFGRRDESRLVRRDAEWIAQRYGVASPAALVAYKALCGEATDNLPGVPGVGPVKARRLLRDYPAIKDLAGALSGERRAAFDLMLRLVTLRADVPLGPLLPADCRIP